MSGMSMYGRMYGLFARFPRTKNINIITRDLSESIEWKTVSLTHRSLIRVSGEEAPVFLQGLITNDINSLENKDCPSVYCMFLNTGGRVLFDTIITPGFQPNELLLEVDAQLSKAVVKHLSMYRVRRKIKIEPVPDLEVFSVFHENIVLQGNTNLQTKSPAIGSTFCDGGAREPLLSPLSDPDTPLDKTKCFPDPRVDLLGYRMICPVGQSLEVKLPFNLVQADIHDYTNLRCLTGVAEGKEEIIPAKALPLEYNLDYLRGVSFHKGCYIGQELTARTHHTGVIRKRIIPFQLSSAETPPEFDQAILNESGRSVGKIRRTSGIHGIGLIRLKEAFEAKSLNCGGATVTVSKPLWWPQEKVNDAKTGSKMSETGDSGDGKSSALVCRLCAADADDGIKIFSERGQEICLPEKISKCLPVLIRSDDDLPKGICGGCQGKLEYCRQFFEQIYNATVKLLSVLRDEEGPNIRISFEDQMLQYVRTYANPNKVEDEEENFLEEGEDEEEEEEELEGEPEDLEQEEEDEEAPQSDVSDIVKAEPEEICDVQIKDDKDQVLEGEDKGQVRHFLDQLLDDYKDVSGSNRRKRGRPKKREHIDYKEELDYEPVKRKRGDKAQIPAEKRALVCPPLKICCECGLRSSSHQENIEHWIKTHPTQPIVYRCDWEECTFSSTIVTEIKKHRRQHLIDTKQLEKCDKCNKYYPAKYLATRHALVHQEGKNYKCEVCEKSFKTPENLKVHSRIHGPEDQKYTHCCELCGRKFTQKANLEAHMRVHTGLRPFSCDFCEKSFSQKGNLDEHRRTHTGEKPYVCDICGSRHTRKGELLLHIRCIHTHERPFQCSYCPKNFQRRDLLRKHERIHTNNRPYGCEFCGKTFTARDKMIVHRRLHTGERPYMCNFCGRGFCESGNLKKHLRVHGKEIPAVIRQNNKGRGVERQDLGDMKAPAAPLLPEQLLPQVADHTTEQQSPGQEQLSPSDPEQLVSEEEQLRVAAGQEQLQIASGQEQLRIASGQEQLRIAAGQEQLLVAAGQEHMRVVQEQLQGVEALHGASEEPKMEDGHGSFEQVKQEDDYRRHSIAEEHDGSQTPASYPHTPQHRAETPQTPEFNLAQRAAEAAQQGYSLVTAHPHHPQGAYTQFVPHPLLHQIQSNWTAAMYSHIQQPPPQ